MWSAHDPAAKESSHLGRKKVPFQNPRREETDSLRLLKVCLSLVRSPSESTRAAQRASSSAPCCTTTTTAATTMLLAIGRCLRFSRGLPTYAASPAAVARCSSPEHKIHSGTHCLIPLSSVLIRRRPSM